MIKKIKYISLFLLLFTTGCFKRDSFDGIKIATTAYPIEYAVSELYGKNSQISSIYPDGSDIDNFKLTKKQIKDFGKSSLFVFNSASYEKEYVIPMFNSNNNLKIIDATLTIDYEENMSEFWMSPSNFLKIISNVKEGLNNYITNQYLKNEIDSRYDKLKISISELDASLREVAYNSVSSSLLVGNDSLKFLNKYGFNVISIDGDVSDKVIADSKNLINNKSIQYLYVVNKQALSPTVIKFIEDTKIEVIELHTLSILSEDDRNNDKNYITIMNENIEKIKQEIFN